MVQPKKEKSSNLVRFVKRRDFGTLEACSIELSTTGNPMVLSKNKKKMNRIVIWRDSMNGNTLGYLKVYPPRAVQ
jgi:hypothetical protein